MKHNYNEVYSELDFNDLINQLNPHLKEELIYAQYGKIIHRFDKFFGNLSNLDVLFKVSQSLKLLNISKGVPVWRLNDLSNCVYFLNTGKATLFADNGYSFYEYIEDDVFGDSEMFMGLTRSTNLEAKIDCIMYQLEKSTIEDILIKFPHIRTKLILSSFEDSKKINAARMRILKKAPIFGTVHQKDKSLAEFKRRKTLINSIKLSQLNSL